METNDIHNIYKIKETSKETRWCQDGYEEI